MFEQGPNSLRKRRAPLARRFETATLRAHVIGRVQNVVTPCVIRKSTAEQSLIARDLLITPFYMV